MMSWTSWTHRLRWGQGGGPSHFVLPPTVLEIEPQFVVGANLDTSARTIRRIGMRELDSQIVNPVPNGTNITNVEGLRGALKRVTEIIGNGARRIGLLVPDGSVRVVVLELETLADDPREAEALLRWRMKDHLSYPPEEAKIAYQVLWKEPSGVGLLVVAAKMALLAEYEQALELKNGDLELVLPATLALVPLVPEALTEAQLLVHVCSGWVTSVMVHGARVRFWRTHSLSVAGAGELVTDVVAEVTRVLASARDHFQVEVDKILLCSRPPAGPTLIGDLAGCISKQVLPLEPGAGVNKTLSAAEAGVFNAVGMPMAGLLSNLG